MREKRGLIMRNVRRCSAFMLVLFLLCGPVNAQYYQDNYYDNQYPYGSQEAAAPRQNGLQGNRGQEQYYSGTHPTANLQYDQRDAEMILRDQMARTRGRGAAPRGSDQTQQSMYENYYGHRIQDEDQVARVMAEARQIARMLTQRNGKPFVVFDKRNFQFYLYDRNSQLLRIGPVAVGKGKTHVGAFETPVGVFPIKTKLPVDDWIRPDWYFIEEGEPIPSRWEDRRVPGFFRYKLVFDGTRYIHYAEATGGRLTHGCLGLDWQDAEAVFHTMEVGSYCIIVDDGFLTRLARGDFPVKKPAAKPPAPAAGATTVASEANPARSEASVARRGVQSGESPFPSLW